MLNSTYRKILVHLLLDIGDHFKASGELKSTTSGLDSTPEKWVKQSWLIAAATLITRVISGLNAKTNHVDN